MINSLPLVSVIVPNYNHARYLPQRIDSVLKQTYGNIELIILDDCSPDNSRSIIAEYSAKDTRIQVVLNERNSGSTFKQWNKGISLAKGKYVWIAESDDYADFHFLEVLVSFLEADEDVGLAYCNSYSVDEDSKIIGSWASTSFYTDLDPVLWTKDFVLNGQYLLNEYMGIRNVIPNASAVVIRKTILEQVGPADETFRLNGDWIFWVKILLISKIAYSAQLFNYFRQHTNNVRSSTTKNGLALLELTRVAKLFKKLPKLEPLFFDRMFDTLLGIWLEIMPERGVSLSMHWQIFRNLRTTDKKFYTRFRKMFAYSMLPNKMHGLRQLINKGIMHRMLKG